MAGTQVIGPQKPGSQTSVSAVLKVWSSPAASASPGTLLEMHHLRAQLQPRWLGSSGFATSNQVTDEHQRLTPGLHLDHLAPFSCEPGSYL